MEAGLAHSRNRNRSGDIAFQQGEKVRTIPLSDKFSGSDLTYSATTSNSSVVTVTVDNAADTLTVTVVGAGTATITVTAENSQGEAKQTFTVTVPKPPAPEPEPDPDPVEIPDISSLEEDATSTILLGDKFSGENLTYNASSDDEDVATVSVNNTADTLTVTAVGVGTATITVTATAQGPCRSDPDLYRHRAPASGRRGGSDRNNGRDILCHCRSRGVPRQSPSVQSSTGETNPAFDRNVGVPPP